MAEIIFVWMFIETSLNPSLIHLWLAEVYYSGKPKQKKKAT